MFVVDRRGFMLWTQGIYLKRDGLEVVIVPSTACEAADKALRRGERIGLTEGGEIVTTMVASDGSFKEEAWHGVNGNLQEENVK